MKTRSPVKPGAFDYLLRDIEQERLVRLDDVIRNEQPPPIPPRREEPPPRRVHIQIDLTEVPTKKPRRVRYRAWGVVWVMITLLLLLGVSNGQPLPDPRPTTTTSYQQGFMTYYETVAPDGRVMRCSSYKEGFNVITRCD
jgi:hypothetical protein